MGAATVRVHPLNKAPIGDEWQHRVDEPDDFNEGENVGVRLGDSSAGLVDLDLDCPEAVLLAPLHLPATATFGRASKPRSHWVYVCPGIRTKKPPHTHVELRANGRGGRSVQTVFPPSIHETGEAIAWTDETPITPVDETTLLGGFGRLCAASVLARAWPALEGNKHDSVLALAGALHHEGWQLEDALRLLLPAMELDGSSEPHRETAIRDTWDNHDRGRYGWPTVMQILGPLPGKAFQRGIELVYKAAPPTPQGVTDTLRPLTDLGNAELFIDQHGEELRYVEGVGWLEWDGKIWSTLNAPVARMGQTVRRLQQIGREASQPTIEKWAVGSEASSRVRAAIAFARDYPAIQSDSKAFDTDPWLLCAPNGVIDLRTGQLRAHQREDWITKMAGVAYDPSAKAPRFWQFLGEIFCGDWDLAGFVLRYLGYALTGSVNEQVFQLWVGAGSNGKSTLIDIVRHVFGEYSQALAGDLLTARRQVRASESASSDVARLRGCRFAAGSESDEMHRWNEPLVKQLTGGDIIQARHLYQLPIEIEPTWKLALAVNHKPQVRGTDHGIWRRIHLVPFDARFEAASQDKQLLRRLRDEGPGILSLLVAACLDWQRNGLQPPARVVAEKNEYRGSQDIVGQFLEECTIVDPTKTASRPKLYQVYRKWCMDGGEYTLGKHHFNNRMRERGWKEQRTQRDRLWIGMALRSDLTFGAVAA